MNKIPKWIRAVWCVLFPTRQQKVDFQDKYGGLQSVDKDSCLDTLIEEGREQANLLREAFSVKMERAKQLITFGSLIWGGKIIGLSVLYPSLSLKQMGCVLQACIIAGMCLTFIGLLIAIATICRPVNYQIVILKALADSTVQEKPEIIKAYSDLQVHWGEAQLMDTMIAWGFRFIAWGGIWYMIGIIIILM